MRGFASCVRHFPTWTGSDALMSLSFRSHGKVSTHLTEQVKRLKGSSLIFLILTEHLLGASPKLMTARLSRHGRPAARASEGPCAPGAVSWYSIHVLCLLCKFILF